ncbi:MAG: Hsp20/alpha crystallin family protein [Nitrospirae bacterium]|nr:Hsp20/alpha crystallin family protein [Nitrospirota bacterium]
MAKKEKKELVKAEPAKALTPFHEMERPFQEIEKRFEDFFRRPFSLMPSWWPRLGLPEMEEISPSVDVFTEGDDVVVKAELPGMQKEDIDVSLTEDAITISGEKKKEEKVEKKDYYSLERSYGSFKRSFSLPAEVQTEKASAKFKDGILEIRIPKTEEAKQKEKKIPIE